jgi:hypothetical protein
VTEPSAFTVVREILTNDLSIDTDVVMTRARKRGLTIPDAQLRRAVVKTRSWMKAKARDATPATAPAAARHTAAPTSEPKAESTQEPADLAGVFANVTRVNAALGACGSVEVAREVAEAVRACGSVDAFLQHLELVAEVRTADKV